MHTSRLMPVVYHPTLPFAHAIMCTHSPPQRLRAGLKAELGALYPLILLKPVEADAPESTHGILMAAEGLLAVCSAPQTLVDLFVNYDCALHVSAMLENDAGACTISSCVYWI